MPVRKRNLRILCGLKEASFQTFPYTLISTAYKPQKKIIFEYWMVPLPFWVWSLLNCGADLTAYFIWKTLWIPFLVHHSSGQLWDSRLRTEFSERGMCKVSSPFLYVFIYLYFMNPVRSSSGAGTELQFFNPVEAVGFSSSWCVVS